MQQTAVVVEDANKGANSVLGPGLGSDFSCCRPSPCFSFWKIDNGCLAPPLALAPRLRYRERAHFGQPLVCRTVRSSSEPRSNSAVTGNLPTSLSRAWMTRSRIIHWNESVTFAQVMHPFVRPC